MNGCRAMRSRRACALSVRVPTGIDPGETEANTSRYTFGRGHSALAHHLLGQLTDNFGLFILFFLYLGIAVDSKLSYS